jgi:hypothetical protein
MDKTETHEERANVDGLNGVFVIAAVDFSMYKHLLLKYEDKYCLKCRRDYEVLSWILLLSLPK